MKSSAVGYWVGRWVNPLIGFAFGGVAVGNAILGNWVIAIGFSIAAVVLVGTGYWLFDRIAIIELSPHNLTVQRGGSAQVVQWAEVASVDRLSNTSPPIYRFSFRNTEPTAYCISNGPWFSFWFLGTMEVWDLSEFEEYARERMLLASIQVEKQQMAATKRSA